MPKAKLRKNTTRAIARARVRSNETLIVEYDPHLYNDVRLVAATGTGTAQLLVEDADGDQTCLAGASATAISEMSDAQRELYVRIQRQLIITAQQLLTILVQDVDETT